MLYSPIYNSNKDIQPVYPGLGVDVEKAIETGIVPDTGVNVQYNDLTEADQIGFRCGDAFQAMDIQRALARSGGNAPAPAGGETV